VKTSLRLRLPALDLWSDQSVLKFALLDPDGSITARGTMTLADIAASYPGLRTEVVLHPDDLVMAELTLPKIPKRLLGQAIRSSIEPMLLDSLDKVTIAYGEQSPDTGTVPAAWISTVALDRICLKLFNSGLKPARLYPGSGQLHGTYPPVLNAEDYWLSELPDWGFDNTSQKISTQGNAWSNAGKWLAVAAVLWITGINLYAMRLESEANSLKSYIHETVHQVFPEIPILLDPVSQAQKQLALRLESSVSASDGTFFSIAQAIAQLPSMASTRIRSMQFRSGELRLDFLQQPAEIQPGSFPSGINPEQFIVIEKSDTPGSEWVFRLVKGRTP